ncbi:MAG: DUF362 domain-containing protein [Sedimentisphaerales bacterium]|nr:DUF362 domain-containing protein [Sedimentisphaerales bacterium]
MSKVKTSIDRREFLKRSVFAVVTSYELLNGFTGQSVLADEGDLPDMVVVRNGELDVMFDKAMQAYGGMGRFVKKGATVVIKPNISWNRPPETAANTNPILVKKVVQSCLEAGAKEVYVFDNTCDNWRLCYQTSGIQASAQQAGAVVLPVNDTSKDYVEVENPKAQILKTLKVHERLAKADVLINVPVLKHHGSTGMTCALKNLMGLVADRRFYHSNGLHQCIAEFCLYRKPTLNIVDAYIVTMNNGPQRARPEDLKLVKYLMVSTDIVAIDAASAIILGKKPQEIRHVQIAHDLKLGTMNLDSLRIQRITV